jgi:hypothetical protein
VRAAVHRHVSSKVDRAEVRVRSSSAHYGVRLILCRVFD